MSPIEDGFYVEKLQQELERETAAVIKLVMTEFERLAAAEPHIASEPVSFNRARNAVIRKIWNLVKESVRYGARTVQRDQPYK